MSDIFNCIVVMINYNLFAYGKTNLYKTCFKTVR